MRRTRFLRSGRLFLASNMCSAICQVGGETRNSVVAITFLWGECVMASRDLSIREAYRQKALHCLRAADKVHGSSERVALLSLASNYMTLADYVGRHDGPCGN